MTLPKRICRAIVLTAALLLPTSLAAFDGLLFKPDGTPGADMQISIVGRSGSVRTDSKGRFTIVPDPNVPFTVIVMGERGEIYPPVHVDVLDSPTPIPIRLEVAYQESVTVSSGIAPNISAPPASGTATVGQEELEEQQPDRLVDALEGVAGVSSTGEGAASVPIIRGLARGRTVILVDDARVTSERRAGASATFLDPFSLESVEVARGPGSVAYGSDAFGGVIHARSREPIAGQPEIRYELSGQAGAEDQLSAGLEISRDVPGGALLGLLHYRDAEDYEAGGGRTILDSRFSGYGGALRFVSDTRAGRFRLGFALDRGRDIGKPAIDSNVTRTTYPTENSERLTLGFDAIPPKGWSTLELRAALSGYQLVLDRERQPTVDVTRRLDRSNVESKDASLRVVGSREAFGGRLEGGYDFSSRFGLEARSEVRQFDANDAESLRVYENSIDDATRSDHGIYFMYDRALVSLFHLSGGIRVDQVATENRGGYVGSRSTDETAFSGHAALTAGPWRGLSGALQIARGFRDPTLSDRYFRGPSGRGFVTGNPDLGPEESVQIDGTLRYRVGKRTIALLAYSYDIDNLIQRYRTGNDFFFRNQGEAQIQGVEIEAETPLMLPGLTLQLGASIGRGEAGDGSPLDDIAPANVQGTLRWAGSRGFGFLRSAAFASDDRNGPTELERPGYTTFDLGAGWRLSRALELRLVARNLADRRYIEAADEKGTWAVGRSFSLGINGRI